MGELVAGSVMLFLALCVTLVLMLRVPAASTAIGAAFIARALLGIIHLYVVPLPDSAVDAVNFERRAYELSQLGFGELASNPVFGAYLYSWIGAWPYKLFGHFPVILHGINIIAGLFSVLFVYRFATCLSERRAGRIAAWVVALYPLAALYSVLTMRESFIVLGVVAGLYYSARYYFTQRYLHVLLSLVWLAFAGGFHVGILVLAAVPALVHLRRFLQGTRRNRGIPHAIPSLIIFVGLFSVAVVLATGWGLTKIETGGGVSLDALTKQQEYVSRERDASYMETVIVRSYVDLLWQTPLRIAHFFMAPFPWMVHRMIDVVAMIDGAVWLLLLLGLWRAWNVRDDDRRALFRILILGFMLSATAFALGTGNYGTAIRHRAKFLPVTVAIWAGARALRKRERVENLGWR